MVEPMEHAFYLYGTLHMQHGPSILSPCYPNTEHVKHEYYPHGILTHKPMEQTFYFYRTQTQST